MTEPQTHAKQSRLIIIINSDLNMSSGLMSAQVSHVSELVGYNAARAMSDLSLGLGLSDVGIDVLEYEFWRTNPITIIKRAPLAALTRFIQEFQQPATGENLKTKKNHIWFEIFRDTVPGLIPADTITCLAIYPGQKIPQEIDELGLA